MFVLNVVVFAVSVISSVSGSVSHDYCKKVQFDFNLPQQAFNNFKSCLDFDDELYDELHQRFLTSWAKYAAEVGVASAIRALENPDVRDVLESDEDWDALMTRTLGAPCKKSKYLKNVFLIQIILLSLLAILTSISAVWTLKLKSAVQRGTDPKNAHKLYDKEHKNDKSWEFERELLLN